MSAKSIEIDPSLLGDQRQMVEAELESGERLLWWARPLAGRLAIRALPLVLFGIPWTAFALFMQGQGLRDPFLFLFGLPFVLIGLGMLTAPYWAWRKALRTVYAITDGRAIIFSAGLWAAVRIRSFGPAALADLKRKQRADGSGDIIFHREYSIDNEGDRRQKEIGFVGVANVRDVETMLRALAETSASAAGEAT